MNRMAFKNTLLIILLFKFFSFTYCQTQEELNCSDFKTGTFEMYVDTLRIITERNLEFQTERTILGNSKYKVAWKSNCEYDLRLLETDFESLRNDIGRVFHVKIISTQNDKYTYECRVDGVDFVDKSVVKKIESL